MSATASGAPSASCSKRSAPARAPAVDAFLASMAAEEAPFMGDTIAFDRLDGLRGLVEDDGPLLLTEDGEAVLAGRADRVALLGFDRWLGGLHVRADGPLWRWDSERATLTGP